MGAERIVAVADAGPLIHLAEIDCLSLLRIFEFVLIPSTVWSEVIASGQVAENVLSKFDSWQQHEISTTEISIFTEEYKLQELHIGERECLFLCKSKDVDTFLTDDLAARKIAHRMNLIPVGSLGIIVRAYHLDIISLTDAERYIHELYCVSSLFVTKTIVDLAIERLYKRKT